MIRGVIGFSQIIKRVILISDVYLLRNQAAEKEILERKPRTWNCRTLGAKTDRFESQIKQFCNKAGLLKPIYSEELKDFFVAKGIFAK